MLWVGGRVDIAHSCILIDLDLGGGSQWFSYSLKLQCCRYHALTVGRIKKKTNLKLAFRTTASVCVCVRAGVCVCACVRACVRESKGKRERERRDIIIFFPSGDLMLGYCRQ